MEQLHTLLPVYGYVWMVLELFFGNFPLWIITGVWQVSSCLSHMRNNPPFLVVLGRGAGLGVHGRRGTSKKIRVASSSESGDEGTFDIEDTMFPLSSIESVSNMPLSFQKKAFRASL